MSPGEEKARSIARRSGRWTVCESPTGNYPPFTKTRGWIVTVPALNGGKRCNDAETVPCVPEVCYYAENSKDPNFGYEGLVQDMRPLRTLPPNHIALNPGKSTLLTSCTNVASLTKKSLLPAASPSLDKKCTGVDLWYALDGATSTSLSGMDKDETVQLFLLQNEGAELFFGLLNGKSRASKDSTATIDISFENIDSKNKDVNVDSERSYVCKEYGQIIRYLFSRRCQ